MTQCHVLPTINIATAVQRKHCTIEGYTNNTSYEHSNRIVRSINNLRNPSSSTVPHYQLQELVLGVYTSRHLLKGS
jgi:hypothetical protein